MKRSNLFEIGIRGLVRCILTALAPILVVSSADGGSQRIDLPELLGEYHFAGGYGSEGKSIQIDTDYPIYGVGAARIVVAGTLTPGKAHGDGLILEPEDFDLLGRVSVSLVVASAGLANIGDSANGEFLVDQTFHGPFIGTTPLPCPCNEPTPGFDASISFNVGPSFFIEYPPVLDPVPNPRDALDGVVVDLPIVVNVTGAYVILTGAYVVPEPQSAILGLMTLGASYSACPRHRRREQLEP